mmetsp:Transcript_11617/g.46981  ORF Transcript_11617/g.46981 Transcript_11617/m.46981 type:complete len:191 (+) Transcript_11617:52-624(+)
MAWRRALAQDVVIGGTICGSGDLGAQLILSEASKKEVESSVDVRRFVAMGTYGATAAVPYHLWYVFLARRFPTATYLKTALECLVVLPLFEIPAVVLWTGFFGRNQTLGAAVAQLRADFWTAWGYGLAVWGPASVAIFARVPYRWHVTSFYSIGALWDFGISYIAFDRSEAAHVKSDHAAATEFAEKRIS